MSCEKKIQIKNTAGKKCIKLHTSIKSSDAHVHDLSFLLDKNTEVVQCSDPLKILLIQSTKTQSRAKHILNEQCLLARM